MSGVLRVPAYTFAHVEDRNTCDVWTLLGPLVFTLSDNHRVVLPPQPCVVVPPNHYVRIRHPVHRAGDELDHTRASTVLGAARCQFPLICSDAWPACLRQPSEESVALGQVEYRFAQPAFPLFPGEELVTPQPEPLPLLNEKEALVLRAVCDFTDTPRPTSVTASDAPAIVRQAQALFLFPGPGQYVPRPEAEIVERVESMDVNLNDALLFRATTAYREESGRQRVAGETWIHVVSGPLFLHPCTTLVEKLPGVVLHPTSAVHVRATEAFADERFGGVARRAGDRWLVTHDRAGGRYLPCDREVVEREVSLTVVGERQYAIVRHPVRTTSPTETNAWGALEMREGPTHFFLRPGEELVDGAVKDAFILQADEALLVEAREACQVEAAADGQPSHRDAGERWLVRGPCAYIPPLTVRVVELRRVILLSRNEGVYVRDTRTGRIRSVSGAPFMLDEYDQLWEKRLSTAVRRLLHMPRQTLRIEDAPELFTEIHADGSGDLCEELGSFADPQNDGASRPSGEPRHQRPASHTGDDDTDQCSASGCEFVGPAEVRRQDQDMTPYAIVSAKVENNTVVRLYDVSTGKCRVVAGPAEVFLEPHEQFTHTLLSGGRPKRPAQMRCLSLYLGPDYMSDIIEVETLDHANLRLMLAYNWEFNTADLERAKEVVFNVSDFIGEACKTLASRVRTAIAGETFDNFHRNSSTLIKRAVFSRTHDGLTTVIDDVLHFTLNGLMITNVDVQSVEPVDVKTRVALTKSVQLAVEIITKTQENEATHNATLLEQEAAGLIDLQVTKDNVTAEASRGTLLEVVASNLAIELAGTSIAQATAESKARILEANAEGDVAPIRCEAHETAMDAELTVLRQRMEADLAHRRSMNELAITKAVSLAEIEADKYEQIMDALGKETVVALARAGPELQQKLLGAMGLEGFLMTDGAVPINLTDLTQRLTNPAVVRAAPTS